MKYFDIKDYCKEGANLYIFIGGRGCGRDIRTLQESLAYLFGGKVDVKYSSKHKYTEFILHNDDIGTYTFIVYNETIAHESLYVRLNRMCEEYQGHLLYMYRDYKE